jgi:hypothetical protein
MEIWSEDTYKGYKLVCTPQLLANGQFRANLLIQWDSGSETCEKKIVVTEKEFNSEKDAAEASRIEGRLWVDTQG